MSEAEELAHLLEIDAVWEKAVDMFGTMVAEATETPALLIDPGETPKETVGCFVEQCRDRIETALRRPVGDAFTGSAGIQTICRERERQINSEGFLPEHDDGHVLGEIAQAAFVYAQVAVEQTKGLHPDHTDRRWYLHFWPWDEDSFNPSPEPLRNLAMAGALIAAEIDRLCRLKLKQGTEGTKGT